MTARAYIQHLEDEAACTSKCIQGTSDKLMEQYKIIEALKAENTKLKLQVEIKQAYEKKK